MRMIDYQDYKYIIQDTSKVYVGAKFSFAEIAKEEELPFKFRSIIMKCVLPEFEQDSTFESLFYYMQPEGYLYELFSQLRTKVKVTKLTQVKNLFGKISYVYKEQIYKLSELAALSPKEKETLGLVIQEIQCSKLAIMTFSF